MTNTTAAPIALYTYPTTASCHEDMDEIPSDKLFNTLRPRQNGRHFADAIFKCIFLNENVRIPIKISMKFAPKGPINNNPALGQILAWHRLGAKPLSEPMTVSLLTHICVTRLQWVKVVQYMDDWLNISFTYYRIVNYVLVIYDTELVCLLNN